MSTSFTRPSATIYQFPVGGRANLALGREASAPTPPQPVIYESAWYHAEAVKDQEPKRPQ
jgi:hypothetical protein